MKALFLSDCPGFRIIRKSQSGSGQAEVETGKALNAAFPHHLIRRSPGFNQNFHPKNFL
jgi:hypothetical protein